MEAARTSETSVDNYFTRQYIQQDKSELQWIIYVLTQQQIQLRCCSHLLRILFFCRSVLMQLRKFKLCPYCCLTHLITIIQFLPECSNVSAETLWSAFLNVTYSKWQWFPLSCSKYDAFFLIFIPDVFRLGDNIFASVVYVKYINLFFKYCNCISNRNCVLGQAFLRVLRFLPVNIIPPLLSKLISSGE
jgi:hypothetical protein